MPTQDTAALVESDVLLSTEEAARFLHVSVQTLADWRCAGSPVPFIKLSRNRVVYSRNDLLSYAHSRRARSTTEARLRFDSAGSEQ